MKALAYTLFSVWGGYLTRRGSQMCGIVCGTIEKSRLETNISRRFSGIEVTGLEPSVFLTLQIYSQLPSPLGYSSIVEA